MTTQLKTADIINFYKTGADEYFDKYIPFVLKRVKKWLYNNSLVIEIEERDYIKVDALSFAYEYYEQVKSVKFQGDQVAARKYWIKTVWLKLLDYLNFTYLNIIRNNSEEPYKKTYFVSLDYFLLDSESEFIYEKILANYHSPSPENLLVEQEEQELPHLFFKMVKDFASDQYMMHNYSIPKQVYVPMIHDCLDTAINTLERRETSNNDRAANLKFVSDKHNVPYKNVNMYYARFKEDARNYLWFIPIYLREKNTPK